MKMFQISIQRAAAEFTIIVLGVLAAFAVDNWNQTRSDAALETQYLERLLVDVIGDIERLELTLRLAERKNTSLATVRGWRSNLDRPEQLVNALSRGAANLGFSLPALYTATIEDLTSSGRLGLISDPLLRQAILEYYRQMSDVRDRLQRRMTPFPGYTYSILEPELRSEDDRVYSEALARCEETCQLTLEAAKTDEFRKLVTAEANYGQEVVEIVSEFLDRSSEFQARLETVLGR